MKKNRLMVITIFILCLLLPFSSVASAEDSDRLNMFERIYEDYQYNNRVSNLANTTQEATDITPSDFIYNVPSELISVKTNDPDTGITSSIENDGSIIIDDNSNYNYLHDFAVKYDSLKNGYIAANNTVKMSHIADTGEKITWNQHVENVSGYAYFEDMPFTSIVIEPLVTDMGSWSFENWSYGTSDAAPDGWAYVYAGQSRSTASVFGTYSYRITGDGENEVRGQSTYALPYTNNLYRTLDCWVKVEGLTQGNLKIDIVNTSTWVNYGNITVSSNCEWTHVNSRFLVNDAGHDLKIRIFADGTPNTGSSFYVDGLIFSADQTRIAEETLDGTYLYQNFTYQPAGSYSSSTFQTHFTSYSEDTYLLSGTPTVTIDGTSKTVYRSGNYIYFDCSGLSTASHTVRVRSAYTMVEPVTSFTYSVASGTTPLAVQFTDSSTHIPSSWSWDFGDGTTSTAQNPYHVYVNPGTYTVTLTSTNKGGSDVYVATNLITTTGTAATQNVASPYVTRMNNVNFESTTYNATLARTVPNSWTMVQHAGDYSFTGSATSVDKKTGTYSYCITPNGQDAVAGELYQTTTIGSGSWVHYGAWVKVEGLSTGRFNLDIQGGSPSVDTEGITISSDTGGWKYYEIYEYVDSANPRLRIFADGTPNSGAKIYVDSVVESAVNSISTQEIKDSTHIYEFFNYTKISTSTTFVMQPTAYSLSEYPVSGVTAYADGVSIPAEIMTSSDYNFVTFNASSLSNANHNFIIDININSIVAGNVYDSDTNAPIKGAVVTIQNSTWSETQVTDVSGAYRFTSASPGTYYIYITASSYETSQQMPVTVTNAIATLNVNLKKSTSYYESHKVQFVVMDTYFNKHEGVVFEIYKPGSSDPDFTGTTGADGSISFQLEQDVTYKIEISKDGVLLETKYLAPFSSVYNVFENFGDDTETPSQFYDNYTVNVTKNELNSSAANIIVNFSSSPIDSDLTVTASYGNYTNGTFNAFETKNATVVNGAGSVVFTVNNYAGNSYPVQVQLGNTAYGSVTRLYSIAFKGKELPINNALLAYFGLFVLFIVAFQFSRADVHYGAFVVCGLFWFLDLVNMFEGLGAYNVSIMEKGAGVATIYAIATIFNESKRTGGD